MTTHVLSGIRTRPLSSYLAGLGLVRLLGEQIDPDVAAWWTDGGLAIRTTVDDLAAWLTERYLPTPVLSPWNEGSGFGAKDKTPRVSLDALIGYPSERLELFRAALPEATVVGARYRAKGWTKERAIRELRNRCPDAMLPWVDAAVVVVGDQTFFPPLLGTGGNDGRLDFSTTFHQRLLELLDPKPKARQRAKALAYDLLEGTQRERLSAAPIGQFDPGGGGGRNSSPFGGAESLVNPWAFVLLVEGALLFASSAARRNRHGVARATMPFTVLGSPEGSTSSTPNEASRGEVWTPVWDRPFTLAEIRQLFAEARADWRGRPAQRAVEFFAATRTFGVARGVAAFERYGMHQRNGLAYVAVPIGSVKVKAQLDVQLAARLEDWVTWARRGDGSSAVAQAIRRYDTAQWRFVNDATPPSLAGVLAAVTDLEQAVARSGRGRNSIPVRTPPSARPFRPILERDPSPELRVAVGIASCASHNGTQAARTMRQLLLPIDPGGRWRDAPVVAGFGIRPLRRVLADVLVWRSRTAIDERSTTSFRGVPTFRSGIRVPSADLHEFAAGRLDESALSLWLRACLALSWEGVHIDWPEPEFSPYLIPTLGLLHPLAIGEAGASSGNEPRPALGPDWALRLTAGQVREVHEDAARRLNQAGWTVVPAPAGVPDDGVAIAAALVPRYRRPREMPLPFARRAKEKT